MDNKCRKLYNKALDLHEKGEINKALDLCEAALAENLAQSEILNFKGLILYEKGLLKEAVTVWKLNADINKDSMSKNYIKDSESDEERIAIYKEAEKLLKRSDINNALKLFLECAKSDFNCIKVNTGIAWCYQKKGDNYRAKEYVDKALKIDKNAVTANEIKKQLEDMDLYYGEGKSKKGKGIIAFVLIAIISACGFLIWKNYMLNTKGQAEEVVVSENVPIENNASDESSNNEEDVKQSDEINSNKFNSESLLTSINDSDYNAIYDNIHNIEIDTLSKEEKSLYNKAVSILKKDGASSFYENGLVSFEQKDYIHASEQLSKAYDYSEGNHLKQHIIFYRGSTASEQDDKELALEMYRKYDELYPKGPYIEGVLYELSLLTYENDNEKSKEYAQKLIDNYPQSIYVNDRIMKIINE